MPRNHLTEPSTEQLLDKVCSKFFTQLESKCDAKLDRIHDKLAEVADTLNDLKGAVANIDSKVDALEQIYKKNTIRIIGLRELPNEDPL
nr:unnamed protein product [Callosobruchus analis]